MSITCLAIAATVCVAQPASIELHSNTLTTGATIKIDDATIESIISSDNIIPANLSIMKEVCQNGSCFHYTRHCEPQGSQYGCNFYYSVGANRTLRKISFIGKEGIILALLRKVGFSPVAGEGIPFSELSYDNGRGGAPSCLRRNGCEQWKE